MSKYEGYFLGADIGTDSVGWCACDSNYNVLKYKGNAMWGVSLFDAANQAAERRVFRCGRRRLDRRNDRERLLQELFSKEICAIDPNFFKRRKESALCRSDRTCEKDSFIFENHAQDKLFYEKYPTIHHLICELMNNKEPHDIRVVYWACSWILAHRGHFLLDISPENTDSINSGDSLISERLLAWFDTQDYERPFECEPKLFCDILVNEKRKQERERKLKELLWNGKNPAKSDDCSVDSGKLIKLICGLKVNLCDLFGNPEYNDIEHGSISLLDGNFDEIIESLCSEIEADDAELIRIAKAISDWAQLQNVLNGKKYISEAKVEVYETHKSHLKILKKLVKKYIPKKYSEIFREAIEKKDNYVKYSANVKSVGEIKQDKFDNCTCENFCKYIKGVFKGVVPDDEDKADFSVMEEALEANCFCPKQVVGENRLIPFQLYYVELKKILENAKKYLPFLNEEDEYGSVSEKILQIMTFRIPYYVGPLVNIENRKNSWIVRKAEGKILPWNFDEIVDKDKSENEFISNLTATCTYIAGEDVLPKNSLLYSKFTVLNEINNIRINGVRLDSATKQGIYDGVFMKRKRVKLKNIRDYLTSAGVFCEKTDKLEGIDISVKSSLKPYIDFAQLFENGILTEEQAERIIERITVTTDKKRLKKWLKENYPLDDSYISKIANLGYSDYGRLSRRFLAELPEVDAQTGEVIGGTIIEQLWDSSVNIMELLGDNRGFRYQIDALNREYYSEHPRTVEERLAEMYVPAAVRRSVIRTLDIVTEVRKLTGEAPAKIFVEMARDHTNDKKGARSVSRKNQVEKYLKKLPDTKELLAELESKSEGELRSDKLFLYFMQLGKCMYSEEKISLEELGTKLYDIDHIYPRSKLKDDSIDNRVLVKSELNDDKKDDFPINPNIRRDRSGFWAMLHKNGLVSDKKFERLTRSTPFSDNELADFINRQLVETRQSTKAVAVLLKEMFPETEIVYVKAGLVSEFRQEFGFVKCRDVNDLHHAKDAYLNIVLGNVYNTKFTKNPLIFIKENEGKNRTYTMKVKELLKHDISRGKTVAWKNGESIEAVKRQLSKNNIRFVRYSYCQKGSLFDQNPLRKGHGQVPRKKNLDIENYGGYQKSTVTYYLLAKFREKKNSSVSLVPVELRFASGIKTFEDKERICAKYAEDNSNGKKTLQFEKLLLGGRIIKVNTLFEIDGFRANLSGKTGDSVTLKKGMPLILPLESENYVKKLASYSKKCSEAKKIKAEIPRITKYDKITSEENVELYNLLLDKFSQTAYKVRMPQPLKIMRENKDYFADLPVETQAAALMNIVGLFGCNVALTDLTLINGSSKTGRVQIAMSFSGISDIRIIDQSPTGLIERRSENLLEL